MKYVTPAMCLTAALLVGCKTDGQGPTSRLQNEPPPPMMSVIPTTLGQTDASPRNIIAVPVVVQLDVYQMWVPYGSVSASDAFWKPVEENAVDVATYDLLFKNGIRVGVAPRAEWAQLKALLDQNPASVQHKSHLTTDPKNLELETGVVKDSQNIFFYDAQNELHGKTHDKAQNVMALTFQPAPRRTGDVRVTLCPVVRSTKKRFEVSGSGEEREVSYIFPERLYDLNLRADIPLDGFLVIAPSIEGRWPTSVGNAFFTRDGNAERLEQVILLVPNLVQVRAMKPTELK